MSQDWAKNTTDPSVWYTDGGKETLTTTWVPYHEPESPSVKNPMLTPTSTTNISAYELKTQKSKGISVLRKLAKKGGLAGMLPEVASVSAIVDVATGECYGSPKFPCFARPCPKTPRHGFVDSRVVASQADLDVVVVETKKADPDSEVMLLPFITSKWNMIWTPAFVSVGLGHDGATAGRGGIRFPLSGQCDPQLKKVLGDALITDFPYVEAVSTNDEGYGKLSYKTVLTQLRNGPVLDTKVDFIERDTLVTEVIHPTSVGDDLLAWEDLMVAKKGEMVQASDRQVGAVVYHPGGSQADHFSIHARVCGIPCVTSFEPKVGETILATGVGEVDYQAVLRGLVAGDRYKLGGSLTKKSGEPSFKMDTALMLMGLHNSGYMEGEACWWFGAAISIMLRLGSMALRGESRHVNPSHKVARSAIYKKAAKMRVQAHAKSCSNLISIFKYGWTKHKTGMGGTKWAQCGLALGHLFNAVRDFAQTPNKESYGALAMTFNSVVNQAHNGGWWMNKFIGNDQFNYVQRGYMKIVLDTTPVMWNLAETYKGITPERVERTLGLWRRWSTIDLMSAKLYEIEVEEVPPSLGASKMLSIKVIDRVLGELRVPFTISMVHINKHLPPHLERHYWVRRVPTGLAVDLTIPGVWDEPVEIWKEPPLTIQGVEANDE